MRIILFTGKGGVGKTTVAAATGLVLAARGLKTLVMSVDAAHSLADAFDRDVALTDHAHGTPVAVGENLWIQEVDVTEEIGRHWKDISGYITTLLAVTGVEEVLAEELAIFPGMEEVSALLYVNQYAREKAFDVLILDCAPTGESLRFVSLPPTLDWYMKKLFRLERSILKVARPVARKMTDLPLPPDRYFDNVQSLAQKLEGVDALLKDPQTTTVRLVTNAEKIVIKETQRAFMYFGLYGFTVDAVIVNRLLPEGVHDPFFDKWRKTQGSFLRRRAATSIPSRSSRCRSRTTRCSVRRLSSRSGGSSGPRGTPPIPSVRTRRIATRRRTGSTSSRSTCRSSTGTKSTSRWHRETSSCGSATCAITSRSRGCFRACSPVRREGRGRKAHGALRKTPGGQR